MLTDCIHSKTLFSNAFLSPNVLQYFYTFMISVMNLVLKELYHETHRNSNSGSCYQTGETLK